jgi:hypothetical protein
MLGIGFPYPGLTSEGAGSWWVAVVVAAAVVVAFVAYAWFVSASWRRRHLGITTPSATGEPEGRRTAA